MKDKIIRVFTCKNGHSYKSKKPINTGYFDKRAKNDMCKKCGAVIISEDDYVDGKLVMGAVRAS